MVVCIGTHFPVSGSKRCMAMLEWKSRKAVASSLGCVDISPQPNESGGEMKEAQISGVQLLKPGEDTAVMLYFVDEAFHQVTLPVQISIVGLGFLPVGARRYDRTHALFQDVLVSQHILTCITVGPLGLRDVVLLTPSQDESQGIA